MGELHRTGRPSRCPRSRGHGTSEESNREDVAEASGTAGDRASPERLGFPSQKAITRKLREVTQGRARDAQSQGGVRRGSPKRHLPRRTACAPGESATRAERTADRGQHTSPRHAAPGGPALVWRSRSPGRQRSNGHMTTTGTKGLFQRQRRQGWNAGVHPRRPRARARPEGPSCRGNENTAPRRRGAS